MDPISALSLAANVVQFVLFAKEVIAVGRQIYRSGSSSTNEDLHLIATDFQKLTVKLKGLSSPVGTPIEDEVWDYHPVLIRCFGADVSSSGLRTLVKQCVKIADELTTQLDKLRACPSQKSRWRTFERTMKVFWSGSKIDAIAKRLEGLRNEVDFHLMVMINQNVDTTRIRMDERFMQLDQRSQKIIQQILDGPQRLTVSLDANMEDLYHRHDQSDALVQRLHQKTIEAINSFSSPPSDQARTRATITSLSDFRNETTITKIDLDITKCLFLNRLRFKQIMDREDAISDVHSETFRWIFQSVEGKQDLAPFDPLIPWLEGGRGCYWINGKAGSGKSTLMRFLGRNSEVQNSLKIWTRSEPLIVASFYGWRSGTDLQRSHEGLLRWLLFTILDQRQDLIPLCFPDHFYGVQEGIRSIEDVTPSVDLLMKAFRIIDMQNLHSKIFFFIDGLDEFDGDPSMISRFLKQLSVGPTFKIIVSSRPISACIEVFEDCPNLRLQDLTYNDIKTFVDDNIGQHERMAMLRNEHPDEAETLVQSILSKASGVFLWVTLVVKSLREGFQNYDRLVDLQDRVDELPQELQELYLHMFQKMEARYQKQASQLLQLVTHTIKVQNERPLTVLQLSFAEEGRLVQAISTPIKTVDLKSLQARCEAMEGRLRSRCCGLIEVVKWHSSSTDSCIYWEVRVLHKSVLDFLHGTQIWTTLVTLTPKLEPNVSSKAASLLEMKVLPRLDTRSYARLGDWDDHLTVSRHAGRVCRDSQILWDCLCYCRLQERSTGSPQTALLDEVKRVIAIRSDIFRTSDPDRKFLLLVVEAGLVQYLRVLMSRDPIMVLRQLDPPGIMERLLQYFQGPVSFRYDRHIGDRAEAYLEIVEILLTQMTRHADSSPIGFNYI